MGKLCDIERVIIILMEQTIEIRKDINAKVQKKKIHEKIQQKMTHKTI